jgi:ADP-heptose:LPS heptosyltransferase
MTNRILIIKFWALGDLLMATPILTALKELYPSCSIDWLVDTDYMGALEGNPLVDEVIAFDSGTWRRDYRYGRWKRYISTALTMRRRLREANYDIVLCLTAEKWWTLWFVVGKFKVGLFPSPKSGLLGRFYTVALARPAEKSVHNTDHYLQVIRPLTQTAEFDRRMLYSVTVERRDSVARFLEDQGSFTLAKPLLILHPGTSQTSKCWPPELYAELIDRLNGDFVVVITGSKKERELAIKIRDASLSPNAVSVAAGVMTSLGETGALVERASIVVTGDTSVLHIASALDTPFVAIYGSSRPGDNRPLYGRFELLYDDSIACAPCHLSNCPLKGTDYLRCQTAISPETVKNSIFRLLKKTGTPA